MGNCGGGGCCSATNLDFGGGGGDGYPFEMQSAPRVSFGRVVPSGHEQNADYTLEASRTKVSFVHHLCRHVRIAGVGQLGR